MPFKHRVNEGSIDCTDCHNPHGSFAATWSMAARPRMVDQAVGNEAPCLKCHTEITAAILDHPAHGDPGRTSCIRCHWSVGHMK